MKRKISNLVIELEKLLHNNYSLISLSRKCEEIVDCCKFVELRNKIIEEMEKKDE
jgi:hypothetical protein